MKKNPAVSSLPPATKAIIFDWAGTIVDYGSCAPALAFVNAFAHFHVEITPAQAREPMGKAKWDHIHSILQMPEVSSRWEKAQGKTPDNSAVDQIYEVFLPLQKEVLKRHSDVIPGASEVVQECRRQGMKIGSSTGYTHALMEVVIPEARRQGYEADVVLCADDDLPAGRPAPWMIFENAKRLNVFPMNAIVKVDDTPVGIEAGRNAGVWTVGISKTGNLVGLSQSEVQALPASELQILMDQATERLFAAGAHYVIESVADLPAVLTDLTSESVNT